MAKNNTKMIIGPSNGWLYKKGIFSLKEHWKFFQGAGANAIEICPRDNIKKAVSVMNGRKSFGFNFISMHLPDYTDLITLEEYVRLADRAKKIVRPEIFLIHPINVPAVLWGTLRNSSIDVAIENMDKRKLFGRKLKEIYKLLSKFSLSFVLDVQHAYEHDHSMGYAADLFRMAKNRLVCYHISGEKDGDNHVLLSRSKNGRRIIDFLGGVFPEKPAPLILEGRYSNALEIKKEIAFLKFEIGI